MTEMKFFRAAYQGNVEVVKEILKNYPNLEVNSADERGALYTACEHGHDSIVSILLAHPGIDVNQRSDGVTPFMIACRCGFPTCAPMLLGDSRVKVNEPGGDGSTPLTEAASEGRLDVIKWWIASEREMNLGTPGNEEMDAIGEAEKEGKTEVVALLERFKGDATKTRGEIRMELGITGQSPALRH